MKPTQLKKLTFTLLLFTAFLGNALACDVDQDNDIDKLDIKLIFQARGETPTGNDDPRDANGDNIINARDGRLCSAQCTMARCAIVTPEPAIAALQLLIIDVEGGKVANAQATLVSQNEMVLADQNGLIKLTELAASQPTTVQLFAPGYAGQIKTFYVGPTGSTTDYTANLIKRQAPKTVKADQAQSLIGVDGAKVSFAANAFVDQSGEPVTGEFDVNITPVDVSRKGAANAFPGSYAGIAEGESEPNLLVSFGTTEYWFSQNGQKLQLAGGQSALIELPIYVTTLPDGSQMQVGDEIPLWFLNQTTGIWQQEGMGTVIASDLSVTGFALQGEVSHFSWWNADEIPGGAGAGSGRDDPDEPSQFTINVRVVLDNPTINGFTTYASIAATSSTLSRNANINAPLNTYVALLVPKGESCFSAQAYLVEQNNTELLGAAGPECVTMNTQQDNNKQLDLVIEQDEDFWGLLTLPACSIIGTPFGPARIVAVKGVKEFSYFASLSPGKTLPLGLSVNQSTGVIDGIPTETGTFTIGTIITEGNGDNHYIESSLILINAPLQLTTDVPQEANLNEYYESDVVTITGGCSPFEYIYKLAEGSLPEGVMLNRLTGQISGIPVSPSQGSFRLEAIDSFGNKVQSDWIQIAFGTPALVPVSSAPMQPNVFWTQSLASLFENLGGPIDELAVSNLPSWLTFNSVTQELSGTPINSGLYTFEVEASNEAGISNITAELSVTGIIQPPQNINAINVGQILKVSWDEVTAATGFLVSVRDALNNQVVSEVTVSKTPAWISQLSHNSNYLVTVSTQVGTEISEPSAAIAASVDEQVAELFIDVSANFNVFHKRPVDIDYNPQTEQLLLGGSGIVAIPLSQPTEYEYVVGDDDISSVSSVYINDSYGVNYAAFSTDAFLHQILQQPTFAESPSLIKQLDSIVGLPAIAKSHNDNITLAYNSQVEGQSILRVSSIDLDGNEIPRMSSDQRLREDVDGDIFYLQQLFEGSEIAAFANSTKVAVPVRTQNQNFNIGQSLLLIDENQTNPLAMPLLFPLQNCSPSFDYFVDKVVVGDIRDIYQSDKNGELLAFIKHDPLSIGGLMRLNINSGECSMLSGIDALGDTYGTGPLFALQNSPLNEISILNEQYFLVIEGVFADYPQELLTVWMVDRQTGDRSQLLKLLYEFGNSDF